MSRHMDPNACVIVVPCLSNHMNSSRYDESWWWWHLLILLSLVFTLPPIALNVFCVNSCDWVFKMEWMVHSVVAGYRWKCTGDVGGQPRWCWQDVVKLFTTMCKQYKTCIYFKYLMAKARLINLNNFWVVWMRPVPPNVKSSWFNNLHPHISRNHW